MPYCSFSCSFHSEIITLVLLGRATIVNSCIPSFKCSVPSDTTTTKECCGVVGLFPNSLSSI